MSRIGKNAIAIPEKTSVSLTGNVLTVKGPLGELSRPVHDAVEVTIGDNDVAVAPKNNSKLARSLWGTFASHIINMITGVNEKYSKQLEVRGVGYKVELNGKVLKLVVGFSHPVEMPIPDGLEVAVEKSTITVSGIDKEQVGQFAANVRATKKPEPYKGKGIRYVGEYVRQKQGKRAA
ncbi:MAG: 50S ribosomal protein L6 [Patescibacteria group bacterium UBA2163]